MFPGQVIQPPKRGPDPSTVTLDPYNNADVPTGDPILFPEGLAQRPKRPDDEKTHGKNVTVVNTAVMRTVASNLQTFSETGGPLTQLRALLDPINVKPGLFHTAQDKIAGRINGGQLYTTKKMVSDLVGDINDIVDALMKAAVSYESADAANKSTAEDFNKYFGQVDSQIRNLGS
jgi:hypothetical protein